jgi:YggT family protein
MGRSIAIVIQTLAQALTIAIIADALLSFFVSPYHPIRVALGRILQPLYAPLRRILPSLGGLDFSPIVLILLIQVVESILVSLVLRLG